MMENLVQESLQQALQNDRGVKAWMTPNLPLFTKSQEFPEMFLTTYRIRNAYEELLDRLREGESVEEEKDMMLVQRWFEMMFYPMKKLSLSQWKDRVEPEILIVRAYKDTRWRKHGKRPHEITLELTDGKKVQINPNDVLSNFMYIRENINSLLESEI